MILFTLFLVDISLVLSPFAPLVIIRIHAYHLHLLCLSVYSN